MPQLSPNDTRFMALAVAEARKGIAAGGIPIGSVLARGDALVGAGHNQRVQQRDPILHGEMDALRNAGRQRTYKDTVIYTTLSPCMMCSGTILQFGIPQRTYKDTVIYTTLSPCMMCSGTILQFGIPRVVIGENKTFGGNEEFLRSRGVEVLVVNDPDCIAMMEHFIKTQPQLWNEDIMVD